MTDYFGLTIPFLDHIGLVAEKYGDGRATVRLPHRRELYNSRGEVQGGALMSALDFAMSAAARSASPDATGAATIDMNASFLAPAVSDLVIEARCVKAGKSIAFCEGEARDAKGELVARATATFKVFRKQE